MWLPKQRNLARIYVDKQWCFEGSGDPLCQLLRIAKFLRRKKSPGHLQVPPLLSRELFGFPQVFFVFSWFSSVPFFHFPFIFLRLSLFLYSVFTGFFVFFFLFFFPFFNIYISYLFHTRRTFFVYIKNIFLYGSMIFKYMIAFFSNISKCHRCSHLNTSVFLRFCSGFPGFLWFSFFRLSFFSSDFFSFQCCFLQFSVVSSIFLAFLTYI